MLLVMTVVGCCNVPSKFPEPPEILMRPVPELKKL